MGRGPGRWQEAIIRALDTRPAVYVADLLPADYSNADYKAILRAAVKLADAGEIELQRYAFWASAGRSVVACRLRWQGTRASIVRLNVDKVAGGDFVNT